MGQGDTGFRASFEAEHQRLYGYVSPERELELVNARVYASADAAEPALPRLQPRESGTWRDAARPGLIKAGGSDRECWFVEREALLAGDVIAGPAVVTEYSATTLVPGGWTLTVSAAGARRLSRGAHHE